MSTTKRIRYVGNNPRKYDVVASTGLRWEPGQVHEVAEPAASRLLAYPSVWAEAVPEAKVEPVLEVSAKQRPTAS